MLMFLTFFFNPFNFILKSKGINKGHSKLKASKAETHGKNIILKFMMHAMHVHVV